MNPSMACWRRRAHDRVSRQHAWRACVVLLLGLCAAFANAATVTTIDDTTMAGQPSVAIGADGSPVVAYRTLGNKLRVAKCNNWDCSDAMRIELSGSYFTTAHFALAITPNGHPGIAFQDQVERRLDVVRCVTADCTGGGHAFFTIDPGPNDVGAYVDWAFGPDNRAAFAYRDFALQALMLARCTTPACTNVDIQMLEGDGPVNSGEYVALAFGQRADPFVSAHWQNPELIAEPEGVHAFDCSVTPCSDGAAMIHYQSDPAGVGQDMAIGPDDLPVFSYLDHTNEEVLFARCQDPDCSGGISHVTLDDGSFTLGFDDNTSIGVRPDGLPVIAYQKQLAVIGAYTALYVVECRDAACSSHGTVQIERSGDGLSTGIDADLAIDHDGAVVIAYFDPSLLDIKLARCNRMTCSGPGDLLFADGFEQVP